MKKATALLLALVMLLALCACGSGSSDTPAPTAAPAQSAQPGESSAPAEEAEYTWPNGNVTVLIPSDAGSPNDIGFRSLIDYLADVTGATFMIENDSTGGGARLAEKLINSKPDGSTIMIGGNNLCAQYYKGLWEHNLADGEYFKMVCGATGPAPVAGSLIVTQPNRDWTTWDELVSYIEANPGVVTVGVSAGKATELKTRAWFNYCGLSDKVRWVSADNSEMLTGLLGGSIDVGLLTDDVGADYVLDGSMAALMLYRPDRDYIGDFNDDEIALFDSLPVIPDLVPEDEVWDAFMTLRSYIFVSADVPDEICRIIADTTNAVRDSDEWMAHIRSMSAVNDFQYIAMEDIPAELATVDEVCRVTYSEQ